MGTLVLVDDHQREPHSRVNHVSEHPPHKCRFFTKDSEEVASRPVALRFVTANRQPQSTYHSQRITVNWGEPKIDIWRLAFEVVM